MTLTYARCVSDLIFCVSAGGHIRPHAREKLAGFYMEEVCTNFVDWLTILEPTIWCAICILGRALELRNMSVHQIGTLDRV